MSVSRTLSLDSLGDLCQVFNNVTATGVGQVAHGFAVGQPIQHDGAGWVLAQADSTSSLAEMVVGEVVDVDTFVAVRAGVVSWLAHGLSVGATYYVSTSTPGAVTATRPGVGELVQAAFSVTGADQVVVGIGADSDTSSANSSGSCPSVRVAVSNTTAVAGELLGVDSTAGPFTITMPAGPSDGDCVRFLPITPAVATNAVTIVDGDTFAVLATLNVEGVGVSMIRIGGVFYGSSMGMWQGLG